MIDWFRAFLELLPEGSELWCTSRIGWPKSPQLLRELQQCGSGRRIRLLTVESDQQLCELYRTAGWSVYPSLYVSAWRRVRFICGTQTLHTAARARTSPTSCGTEATILYSSCFDANGGVFEVLFGAEDAIISDELNHASIIDGIRLSQGRAVPLQERRHDRPAHAARGGARPPARGARSSSPTACSRWTAPSPRSTRSATWPTSSARWCSSTTRHAVGFVGDGGRGTPELFGVMDRVDIITGTLGKALGGASGGYVAVAPGDRRPAAPAVAALPVLQLGRADRRRRLAEGAGDRGRVGRGARAR